MDNLKDKTVCIFDSSSFTPFARAFMGKVKKIYYYSQCEGNGFPQSEYFHVGTGIDGVERIDSWLDKISEVDLWVFTDVYYVGEQLYLKSLGKRVWGCGLTSWMELDRMRLKEWLDKNKMPVPESTEYIGIKDLIKNVKPEEFIKISYYRGDEETIKYYDRERSELRLKEMEIKLGAIAEEYVFITEEKIEGIEIGADTYSVDGQYPSDMLWGIEIKDAGYLGKICSEIQLPKQIRYINDKIKSIFKEEKTRGHFSYEIRTDNPNDGYLIDFTARMPNPPYQLHIAMTKNLPEIIWYGSQGIMVQPEYNAKYGAIAIMKSEYAKDHYMPVRIPDKSKEWVYLMEWMVDKKGEYWSCPISGFDEFGAVVGIGNTQKEAIDNLNKNAKDVKGDGLVIETPALDEADKQLKDLRKYGVTF